jgi:hypothetical protein
MKNQNSGNTLKGMGGGVLVFLFIYLAVLNILDGIVTFMGLTFGKIEEANPIMNLLFETSPGLFLGIKIGLSLLLILIYINLKILNASIVKSLLLISSILYSVVCFQHYYWLTLVTSW